MLPVVEPPRSRRQGLRGLYEQWLEAQASGRMSSWWIDHYDRHATVLFAKRGPFDECGTTHVGMTARRVLATEQPPVGVVRAPHLLLCRAACSDHD
ncbi:DUF4913 domain-containing protein [Arthrobacter sp. Z1-15]